MICSRPSPDGSQTTPQYEVLSWWSGRGHNVQLQIQGMGCAEEAEVARRFQAETSPVSQKVRPLDLSSATCMDSNRLYNGHPGRARLSERKCIARNLSGAASGAGFGILFKVLAAFLPMKEPQLRLKMSPQGIPAAPTMVPHSPRWVLSRPKPRTIVVRIHPVPGPNSLEVLLPKGL